MAAWIMFRGNDFLNKGSPTLMFFTGLAWEAVGVDGSYTKCRTQGLHPEPCVWLGLGDKSTLITPIKI